MLNFLCFRSEFAASDPQSSDKQILNVYDLGNKFIAYSSVFDDVVDVLAEWGCLYVLTRDGKLHALQEKDTQTKLEASGAVRRRQLVSPWLVRFRNAKQYCSGTISTERRTAHGSILWVEELLCFVYTLNQHLQNEDGPGLAVSGAQDREELWVRAFVHRHFIPGRFVDPGNAVSLACVFISEHFSPHPSDAVQEEPV